MLKKIISVLLMWSIVLSGIFTVPLLAPQKVIASIHNDLAQRPIMGWSSWSSIRKNPTEKKIKAAADILAAKFKGHGYQYVNLDDYYQLNWSTKVDKYGRWVVDPKKFPHGMKVIGDYIHKKGLKFGLYVTPGIPKGAVDQNTPIEGTSYHAKDIVDLSKGQKVNYNYKNMYSIDFSKPGAQEFIDSWAKLFASYGVDYLKIDGVGIQDIPDIEAWAKALKKTGRPIHVELSNNLDINSISKWKQLSNGWRTSRDVESYEKDTITDWNHVSLRFTHAAKWQPHAEPGGWNDLDSLNVANGKKDGLTNNEKRSSVSLWAIAASHFIIGSDLTKLDNYGFSLLTNDEILGANQSGVAGKRLFHTSYSQVFYQNLPDGSYNVGLFNTSKSSQKVSVKWRDLGIDGPAFVHDMWSHQDLGSMESGFTANLSPHASRMIHVVPASSLTVSPKSGATGVNPPIVSLKWAAQPGADSYHVQVATDSNFTNIISDQILTSSTTNVDNLKTDSHYYWKVFSLSDGVETQIGIYSFHTIMTTVPAPPDWVLTKRKNKNSISLYWNPTFGATSYSVYRKTINRYGDGIYTKIASNLTLPIYVDKTAALHRGVRYSYVITAMNAIGESAKPFDTQKSTDSYGQVTLIILLMIVIFVIIFLIVKNKFNSSKPV